jgi:hypothetical protein
MARYLTLTAFLVAMFVIAACSGGGPQGSERAASSEPQQTQMGASSERVPEETAPERASAEDEAPKSAKEDARGGEGSSSLTVTTIEGEEVELGAQGDVTALFFMAGW